MIVDNIGPSQLTFTAVSGATGDDVVVPLLPLPVELDLNEDTDGNGTPGPFAIPFPTTPGSFTAGASGEEACFNYLGQTSDPMELSGTQSHRGHLGRRLDHLDSDVQMRARRIPLASPRMTSSAPRTTNVWTPATSGTTARSTTTARPPIPRLASTEAARREPARL